MWPAGSHQGKNNWDLPSGMGNRSNDLKIKGVMLQYVSMGKKTVSSLLGVKGSKS